MSDETEQEPMGTPSPAGGFNPEDLVPLIERTVASSMKPYMDRLSAPQAAAPSDPSLEDVWYDSPAKAAELIQDRILGRVRQEWQQIQHQQDGQQVWQKFQQSFPHLAGSVDFAQTLFARDPAKYQAIERARGTQGAMAALAGDLELAIHYKADTEDEQVAETLESSQSEPAPAEPQEAPKQRSLGEIHKAKMAARRAALVA